MGECVKALRKPDVPRYDHTKDGTPFYWVLKTAAQQRNEEEATASRLTELKYRTFREKALPIGVV